MLSVIQIIIIAVNINILILGVIFLFLSRGNRLANILLGMFLISIGYTTFSMTILEDIILVPHLIRIYEPVSLLILPSFYGYFKVILDENKKMKPIEMLHFLPSIISLVILLPFLLKPGEVKIQWLQASILNYKLYQNWNILYFLQLVLYIFFFVRKIKQNPVASSKKTSENKIKIIRLVKSFAILLLGIFSAGVLLMFLFTPNIYFLAVPVQLFVIYGIYLLVKASKLIDILYAPANNKTLRFEKLSNLVHYLDNTEDYYNPFLSLEYVSNSTGIGIHEISRYINEVKGMSFNDFINQKRIEEVLNRLHDPDYKKLSIEGIGRSVGFRSKSTFYRAFKKYTKQTPGDYIQDITKKSTT